MNKQINQSASSDSFDRKYYAPPKYKGFWRSLTTCEVIEVYPLSPVGGTLCFCGPEIGLSYSGMAETQEVWNSDEWQGHVPVNIYCTSAGCGPWEFLYL